MQKKTVMKMTSDHYVEIGTYTVDVVADDATPFEVDLEVDSTQKMLRYINLYISFSGTGLLPLFAGGDGTSGLNLTGTFYSNTGKAAADSTAYFHVPDTTGVAAATYAIATGQTAAAMNAAAAASGEVVMVGPHDTAATLVALENYSPKMSLICTMAGTAYTAGEVHITVEGVTW